MAGILEVLTQAGSIPMDELKIRSSGSSSDVEYSVTELEKQGLVQVSNDPALITTEALDDDRLVKLTDKGLRSAFR